MKKELFGINPILRKELIDIVVRGEKAAHQGKGIERSLSELTRAVRGLVDLDEVVRYFIFQQGKKIDALVSAQNRPKEDPEQKDSIFDFEKNSGIDPLEAFICVKALVEEQLRIEMGSAYEIMKNKVAQNEAS